MEIRSNKLFMLFFLVCMSISCNCALAARQTPTDHEAAQALPWGPYPWWIFSWPPPRPLQRPVEPPPPPRNHQPTPPVNDPIPPPPRRRTSSGKGDPSNCSAALIYIDGCASDLIRFFFRERVSVGSACCEAISRLSDRCFYKAFTQFSEPIFCRRVRNHCAQQH